MKTLTVRKNAFTLQNTEYSFHEYGLSVKIKSWTKAFKEYGFERIKREKAEKILPFDDPNELQDSNTYNDNTNLANDINYGINEVPSHAPHKYAGGTLLVFKEHKGGDIRGAYKQSVYMYSPKTKEELMHELHRILALELNVEIEDQNGNMYQARIDPMGYHEVQKDEIGLDDDDVMGLMEKTGNQKIATVTHEVESQ